VLVTSRAALRLGGEREYPVPPLGLAVEGGVSPSAALLASDAGRLFYERARAHDPRFTIDDAGATTIAGICARLDGLPLAIELAAARMKTLTPRALLARLDRWLPLLTEGDRDAPTRLQTMRNAIAWSYDLLDRQVQAVFRRLAVFAGGFTLDGAEAVCAGGQTGGFPFPSVLDAVSTLVEQSLAVRTIEADGLPRFRMVETVREFGLELLTDRGEEAEARSAHARYFLDLAARHDQAGVPGNHERLQALLDTQRADFLAALTWLDTAGPLDAFFRLLMTFENSWVATGLSDEGSRWLERALAKSDEMSIADRAMVLVAMGRLAVYRGRTSGAERLVTEAVALLRREDDRIRLAMALIWLGVLAMQTGDYERAETPLEEARIMC
jgi:predicted ATPase